MGSLRLQLLHIAVEIFTFHSTVEIFTFHFAHSLQSVDIQHEGKSDFLPQILQPHLPPPKKNQCNGYTTLVGLLLSAPLMSFATETRIAETRLIQLNGGNTKNRTNDDRCATRGPT